MILLGCGHAGLVNTLQYVSGLLGEKRIYAIIGGTHLISASPQRMEKTIEALRKYDVQKIMLMHCTGLNAYVQLSNAFPGRGSMLGIMTSPRKRPSGWINVSDDWEIARTSIDPHPP